MSQNQQLSFRWFGGIATAIMSLWFVFTTFVASPKEVAEMGKKVAAIEARANSDHELLIRIEQNQMNQLQMLQELKVQIRNK